jgi:hypothetical protein
LDIFRFVSFQINQNEDHKIVEPERLPTPEPVAAVQTIHVESTHVKAPAPQPQENGDAMLRLNMSAKEYRDHLRSGNRHSQKNVNVGFKNKKDFFDRL